MTKKIINVLQRDIKDCGPCALQSIIRYYGGYVPVEKIREDTLTTNKGTSLYHLMDAAKTYGFDAIAKKYDDKNLEFVSLPAIVHVKYPNGLMHFMVLYAYNKKVVLMDPAKGKVTMNKKDFNDIFTGATLELSVSRPIINLAKENNIYKLFFAILKNNKSLCLRLLFCSLLFTILTITFGMYFKVGYEMIINNKDIHLIHYTIYLFLLVVTIKIVVEYMKNYYENYLNKNIDVSIFSDFVKHIFYLPLKVISTRSTGEIMTRINEISSVKDLFSEIFVTSFLDLLLSLGTIICLFYINKSLSLILCFIIIIYIIISLITSKYVYNRIKHNIELQTKFNAKLIENIDMLNSIKNMNKTEVALSNIEESSACLLYDNFTFSKFISFLEAIKNSINELGIFILNTYGLYLMYSDKISIISLITFNTLMIYFINPIKNIMALLPKFNFLRASFRKICEFTDLEEEQLGNKEKFVSGDIKVQNLSFTYDKCHQVLDNVSFRIKKGEKVMLKGYSGCGKSTLCNILQGHIKQASGQILINNKNIADYSKTTLRNNICYVGQKEALYSDTIKNNILFYRKENKLFSKVCQICKIEDIVSKKTFRYDFGIDNSSDNISGGEKQRIILARGLMQDASILVLDEALSETDYNLEKEIIQNIIKAFPEKTLIYISHKNHEKLFDRVIKLKENAHEM